MSNTDPMELPGAHWIAIYFDKQVKGEFFDSYGKHPIHHNKHFLDFMNRNAVEWEHNKISFKVLSRLSVDNIVYVFCIIGVGKDQCHSL